MTWILLCLTCLAGAPQDKHPSAPASPPQVEVAEPINNTAAAILAYQVLGLPQPKPGTLEEAITAALQQHPDIRIAQAKLQMAEAELAQARLLITQKVTAAHADIAVAKADLQMAEKVYARLVELEKRKAVSSDELTQAHHKLEQTRATLAAREAALQVLVGQPTRVSVGQGLRVAPEMLGPYLYAREAQLGSFDVKWLDRSRLALATAAPQPVADKLKAALEQTVRMPKHQGVELETYLQQLLKEAKLDLKVRLPATENKQLHRNVTKLDLDEGEYPLRVWFQLVLDETNNYRNMGLQISPDENAKPMRYDLYLREYGLLLSTPELAPPDAMTVNQLWKQALAERVKEKAEAEKTKK